MSATVPTSDRSITAAPRQDHFSEAVFIGRFQPFHLGHLEHVMAARNLCDFLWIGITLPGFFNPTEYQDSERSRSWSNPLTYAERAAMIQTALTEAGIPAKSFACVPFPVETPGMLPTYLPATVPVLTTITGEWGRRKTELLERAGYKVVTFAPARATGISGSQIRNEIMHDQPAWRVRVPASVAAAIDRLGVKVRLRNLDSESAQPISDLSRPITGMLPADLPLQIERLITSPQDIVFTTGAHAEGLGNSYSDIDLFGVYTNEVLPTGTVSLLLITDPAKNGYSCVDFQPKLWRSLHDLSERLNNFDVNDAAALRSLKLSDLDLYYRIATGVAVFNPEGFAELKSRFHLATVGRLVQAWSALRCADALHAARANVGTDQDAAIIAAQDALDSAIDSFLAGSGDSFPTLKWRFEKLKRSYGEDSKIFRRAWGLKGAGNRPAAKYVREVAEFCAELGFESSESSNGNRQCPIRSSLAHLFTIGEDHYIVWNRLLIFQLNEAGRKIWDVIDGLQSIDQIVAAYAMTFLLEMEDARRHVGLFLAELQRFRLIEGVSSHVVSAEAAVAQGLNDPGLNDRSLNKPRVFRLERTAGEVALSLAHAFLSFSRDYEIAKMNITGGIEAGQHGLVLTRCRDALRHGLTSYLATRYRFDGPDETLHAVVELHNEDSELVHQLRSLLRENPESADEVVAYSQRCIDLVEEKLGLKTWRRFGGRNTQAEYDQRARSLRQMAALTDFLGIEGPYRSADLERARIAVEFFLGHET